ncbi:MAG: UbiX family flavin prenyltransferase [Phycisphaerae bacterium]|nr:UbiX family flavin prenyltransferase [Phycisphaerae bacterium]
MARAIVLAVTGASGAAYARALGRILVTAGARVHWIVSPHGEALLRRELGVTDCSPRGVLGGDYNVGLAACEWHEFADLADPLACGSTFTDAMAICPCSAHTLAAVAAGLADNLITRAAHVHLKQRRPLVLVPREMPLTVIDLENQLRLARAGGVIAPACPGFYNAPKTAADVVHFVASRVADLLGVREAVVEYKKKSEIQNPKYETSSQTPKRKTPNAHVSPTS